MNISLFLGAGASVLFGKPTTSELKRKLLEKYKDYEGKEPELFYIHNILSFEKFEDIEHVLQCIKEIDDFFTSSDFGGKYFLEWYRLQASDGRRPWPLGEFIKKIKIIRSMIEKEIFENYRWEHGKDDILRKIYDVIFTKIIEKTDPIRVFTTNYDSAIEEYCRLTKNHKCIDGFNWNRHSRSLIWDGIFSPPDNGVGNDVYLYKLHGSLNWKLHVSGDIGRTLDEAMHQDPNLTDDLLVYPTVSPKDGYEKEPYKTIRSHFERELNNSDACIVIGFSFRDDHIKSVFKKFVDDKKALIIISPSSVENTCKYLLEEEIPKYDKGKVSLLASGKYENVWCIPDGISVENIEHQMILSITHINAIINKKK